MGTATVLVGLIGVVSFIIRGMIKDKKAGKSVVCGGKCDQCHGHCSH